MSEGCGPIFGIASNSSRRSLSLFSVNTFTTASWLTGSMFGSSSRPTS